jgi:hypothetical protein
MILHILGVMFSWPDGIVVGNLIASMLWAPLGIIHLDRLARKHHGEHMRLLRKEANSNKSTERT